jgi:hypothetical protein
MNHFDYYILNNLFALENLTMSTENTQEVNSDVMGDPFGFTLDKLNADAAAAVENPIVRAAIERIKHGHAAEGFKNKFDKAYHSHSKTR